MEVKWLYVSGHMFFFFLVRIKTFDNEKELRGEAKAGMSVYF